MNKRICTQSQVRKHILIALSMFVSLPIRVMVVLLPLVLISCSDEPEQPYSDPEETNSNENFIGGSDATDPYKGSSSEGESGGSNSSGNSTLINGHEAVDLGLSVKWAACNVGAKNDKPEDYGYYFAWGETAEKSSYDSSNSETYGKTISWLTSNGYLDSKGNLTMAHDTARANWGGTWRMPTKAEMDELIANTTTTWKTQNGVKGMLVTSKINGNSIFLPAAGSRTAYGSSLDIVGERGYYWSSTPYESSAGSAYRFLFYSGHFNLDWSSSDVEQRVRAVTE